MPCRHDYPQTIPFTPICLRTRTLTLILTENWNWQFYLTTTLPDNLILQFEMETSTDNPIPKIRPKNSTQQFKPYRKDSFNIKYITASSCTMSTNTAWFLCCRNRAPSLQQMGKGGGKKKKIEDGETYGFCPREKNPHNLKVKQTDMKELHKQGWKKSLEF